MIHFYPRKSKLQFTVALLLCITIFLNITVINSLQTKNFKNTSTNKITSTNPYFSGEIYSNSTIGMGENINITLYQRYLNDTATMMNREIQNNLTLNTKTPLDPFFNTSFINLTIGNLAIDPVFLQGDNPAEDPEDTDNLFTDGDILATNFTTSLSGNISSFAMYHNHPGGNSVVNFHLWNATWNETIQRPEPQEDLGLLNETIYSGVSNQTYGWYNYSVSPIFLDPNNTDNCTWFISMYSASIYRWRWVDSLADGVNETVSYKYVVDNSQWVPQENKDLIMDVNLVPGNFSAIGIGMKVNGSLVSSDSPTEYNASFISYGEYSGNEKGDLTFEFTAEWPKASWVVNKTEVIFSKNDIHNQSTYYIPGSGQNVTWSIQYNVTQYNSTFSDFRINFTVPKSWTPIKAYRDNNTQEELFAQPVDLDIGYKTIQIDAPEPYGNNTWILNLTCYNNGMILNLLNGMNPVTIANNQDILNPKILFNGIYNGMMQLEIFNNTKDRISGPYFNITFDEFEPIILNSIFGRSYGLYTFQVIGDNAASQALLLEKELNYCGNTYYSIINSIDNGSRVKNSEIFNISIFFSEIIDTNTNYSIDDATLYWGNNYENSYYGSNGNPGYYNLTINSSNYNEGLNSIQISLNKSLYVNQTFEFCFYRNNYPSIEKIQIVESNPYTYENLNTIISGWNDIDGDIGSSYYRWFIDKGSGFELIAFEETDKLDRYWTNVSNKILIEVTPYDGYDFGKSINSSAITIRNSIPEISNIVIYPSNPDSSMNLTVNVSCFDWDNDTQIISYEYRWFVNNIEILRTNSNNLEKKWLNSSDIVFVQIIPFDGLDYGNLTQSSNITIQLTTDSINNQTDITSSDNYNNNTHDDVNLTIIIVSVSISIAGFLFLIKKKIKPQLNKNIIQEENK